MSIRRVERVFHTLPVKWLSWFFSRDIFPRGDERLIGVTLVNPLGNALTTIKAGIRSGRGLPKVVPVVREHGYGTLVPKQLSIKARARLTRLTP